MRTKGARDGGRTDRATFDRAVALAAMLYEGKQVTAKAVVDRFGVALSTAHRDLCALECLLPVQCREEHRAPWPHPRKILTLKSEARCG